MNEQTNPEQPPDDEAQTGVGPQAHEPGSDPAIDLGEVKRVLEAALLSTSDPLTVQQLKRLFAGEVDADNIRKVLDQLKDDWAERSIELTSVASGWRFRVKPDTQKSLTRIPTENPPPTPRPVLEPLPTAPNPHPAPRAATAGTRGGAA